MTDCRIWGALAQTRPAAARNATPWLWSDDTISLVTSSAMRLERLRPRSARWKVRAKSWSENADGELPAVRKCQGYYIVERGNNHFAYMMLSTESYGVV